MTTATALQFDAYAARRFIWEFDSGFPVDELPFEEWLSVPDGKGTGEIQVRVITLYVTLSGQFDVCEQHYGPSMRLVYENSHYKFNQLRNAGQIARYATLFMGYNLSRSEWVCSLSVRDNLVVGYLKTIHLESL